MGQDGSGHSFQALSNFARLDTLVTVVDALNVYDVLDSLETLATHNVSQMVLKYKDEKIRKPQI